MTINEAIQEFEDEAYHHGLHPVISDEAKAKALWALREYASLHEQLGHVTAAALALWGAEAQTLMMFEEMAELQKELCKNARGKDNRKEIAEEIADVRIMLDQMEILHNCKELSRQYKVEKLLRLLDRIEEAQKEEE